MFKYKDAIIPISIAAIVLSIILFSEDRYRYPCQDPENWDSPQCKAPLCEASSTCTSYLVDVGNSYESVQENIEDDTGDGMMCTAKVEKMCTGDECLEIKINDCQTGE